MPAHSFTYQPPFQKRIIVFLHFMAIIKILLLPFAALYNLVTAIRNRLYDLRLRPSVKFDIPVINVGNLTVGGTGKTPMIEHLVRSLSSDYHLATLSRGYGRKTKGMRIANSVDDATTLGDEPFQLYKKYNQKILVAVGEERALAIPHMLHQFPETQVVLLDDAYQHRAVTPSLNVLLTDYNNLFYNDLLLPAGRLRESRRGASRADVIVVTKCAHDISEEKRIEVEKNIRKYVSKPVFFTKIRYGFPISLGAQHTLSDTVILMSGIANHKPLEQFVRENYKMIRHIVYPDHYSYTASDLEKLVDLVKKHADCCVLTTEKDKVKLESQAFKHLLAQIPLFYLPIEIEFIKNGKDFDAMVLNSVKHAGDK